MLYVLGVSDSLRTKAGLGARGSVEGVVSFPGSVPPEKHVDDEDRDMRADMVTEIRRVGYGAEREFVQDSKIYDEGLLLLVRLTYGLELFLLDYDL